MQSGIRNLGGLGSKCGNGLSFWLNWCNAGRLSLFAFSDGSVSRYSEGFCDSKLRIHT